MRRIPMTRNFTKNIISCLLIAVMMISLTSHMAPYAYAVSQQPSKTQNIAQNSLASIDYSNASSGYIFVRYTGGSDRQIVVEVLKNGRVENLDYRYLYRINNYGRAEQLVLSEGNGKYVINVFRAFAPRQYNLILTATVEVRLSCEMMPFLQPNKFVNFTTGGAVASLAERLQRSCPIETTRVVFGYVHRNIRYDFGLAQRGLPEWYEPNLEQLLLETRRGVCFDMASLMTAILRINDIPAKMVFGYIDEKQWHAWVNVYFQGYGWVILDPTINVGDYRILHTSGVARRQQFADTDFNAVQFF